MTARRLKLVLALLLALPACAWAGEANKVAAPSLQTRNGREIYQKFREGLADPDCGTDASARWQSHFAHAPKQLAAVNGDVLPLFGYVVDAMRKEHLPTEFALIPFVESGYKPGARSPQGPAGLWQMIAVTARNHKVPIRAGYDGRLSPVDSTAAAVRYLKTLHGMFAGDWRLAVMAYNAGEYRVLGALKRSGQTARNAKPETLPGLSPITHAYVRKLHALSCLMEQAEDRSGWMQAMDRPVPILQAVVLADGETDLATWAGRNGQDAAQLQRLNPVYAGGRVTRAKGSPARLLAAASTPDGTSMQATAAIPAGSVDSAIARQTVPSPGQMAGSASARPVLTSADASEVVAGMATEPRAARRHTIVRGDTASGIAARYGISVSELLERNGLTASAVLRPGKTLVIDQEIAAVDAAAAATP